MIEVHANLFVGHEGDCFFYEKEGWAVVHGCKIPCHQHAVGYSGNLPRTHPNYLVLERGSHLFLNMIDPDLPLFMPATFAATLAFMDKFWGTRKILIHCNQGNSRAPSLALLFLAKRLRVIDGTTFDTAARDFKRLYPPYQPGAGLLRHLRENWTRIE